MRAITVLGSGNAYFEDGRGHASFLAEGSRGRKLLVDAGATTLLRLRTLELAFDDLDHVLITHFHGDHTLGIPPLLLHMNTFHRRERPLVLAGPSGLERAVGDLVAAAFPGFSPTFAVEFVEIEDGGGVVLGGFRVQAVAQTHRPESLGYRVTGPAGRTVAFSGDCRFDDRLRALVDGTDLALVEVALPGGPSPDVNHISLAEMLAGRPSLAVPRLVFTHLNDRIAVALESAGIGVAARDGLRVEV